MGAFASERSQEWTFTFCIMEYQHKTHSVGFFAFIIIITSPGCLTVGD